MSAYATVPDFHRAAAGQPGARASRAGALLHGLGREWRRASWVVRLSISCLLVFYFLGRRLAFCRPVRSDPPVSRPARLSADASSSGDARRVGARILLRLSDADERRGGARFRTRPLAQDLPEIFPPRPPVHHRVGRRALLHHGQRRAGPRPLLAHRLRRARQHVRRPHRRADQFLARHHGGRVLGLRRRAHRQSDHALVGDRDVAAIILLPARAGGSDSFGSKSGDDLLHDRCDHELHQLGRFCPDHPRDGGLGALAPLRRGGARAGRLTRRV